MDPRIISLDIETYGALGHDQTCFTPQRALYVDAPPPPFVLTASITIPTHDPRSTPPCSTTTTPNQRSSLRSPTTPNPNRSSTASKTPPNTSASHAEARSIFSVSSAPSSGTDASPAEWNSRSLAQLEPGPTITFDLRHLQHRTLLYRWLRHADTIIGHNILFDLAFLSHFDGRYATLLSDPLRYTIIDTMVLAYLHNEMRPERSLKSLGPILNTHLYEDTLSTGTINTIPKLIQYNAQDSHNTLLLCAALASAIATDHHDHPHPCAADKASSSSLRFYSDSLHVALHMTLSGIPYNHPRLTRYMATIESRLARIHAHAHTHDLLLANTKDLTGSDPSRRNFLLRLIHEIDASSPGSPSILDNPHFQVTDKKKEVAITDGNRELISSHLPAGSPSRPLLDMWDQFAHYSKLLSTYLRPMLQHGRSKKRPHESILVPHSPTVAIAYPSWFVVPSSYKDGRGAEGGTLQGRITCKNHAAQTDPKRIRQCRTSRWTGGHLVEIDLSQIELRVAALLSGEPTMLEEYAKPKPDLHTQMTVAMYGPSITDHPRFKKGTRDDPRQGGKTANFLVLFRGQADKYRLTMYKDFKLDLPLERCQQLINNAWKIRQTLWNWQETLIAMAHDTGMVCLPFTGQSRYYLNDPKDRNAKYEINEIVNTPIQTTAGNVMLRIQAAVLPLLPRTGIRMCLNTYDSILFDTRTTYYRRLLLDTILPAAFNHVRTRDYWARLIDYYGNFVPLTYESK